MEQEETWGPQAWDVRYEAKRVWSKEPNRFLVDVASELNPGRALDLGAGEGRNAIWLAERGWEVTAADFSAVGVARGKADAEERGVEVDWRVEDVLSLRTKPGSFDLVVISYLHLPPDHLGRVFALAATSVACGGYVLVVGHDRENLTQGYGGPRDPEVLYSGEMMERAFPNLRLYRNERVIREVETEEGARRAIDRLAWARREEATGNGT